MCHLRVVLQTLKEHQLFSKYSKCEFWLRSVTFLGHIICSEGVEVDPRKMELSPTDIRSFFGSSELLERFVDSFASIASPSTTLTQKCKKFECSKACEISFQIHPEWV